MLNRTMKDKTGVLLKAGDQVMVWSYSGHWTRRGTVTGFTPKRVRVDYTSDPQPDKGCCENPHWIIIMTEQFEAHGDKMEGPFKEQGAFI